MLSNVHNIPRMACIRILLIDADPVEEMILKVV
jgi:hypothetical protein